MKRTNVVVSLLAAALPALLGAAVHELSFPSGETELRALLHVPDREATETVVVSLHGNPGAPLGPESWIVDPLLDRGIAVFRFNYRGLWGNEGAFELSSSVGDLASALTFLVGSEEVRSHGVDPRRIYLFGYSYGTAVALNGAHDDDRVAGIASLAPCDHGYFGAEFADPASPIRDFLDTVVEELFGENGFIDQDAAVFTGDLVENAEAYRFPPLARSLRDQQLLFLVGLDDAVCSAEDHFLPLYRALRAVNHPATEAVVFPMDHGTEPMGREAIAGRLADWVATASRVDLAAVVGSDEQLAELAASYTAAWNSGDPEEVARHYAEEGSLSINGGEPSVGREALAAVAESFMTGFPDLVLTFDGLSLEDGRIRFHWTFRGTNSGPGGTGRRVEFSGFEAWILDDDGRISDSLGRFDAEEYRRQLEQGVPGSDGADDDR